jgi:hypothetical protein
VVARDIHTEDLRPKALGRTGSGFVAERPPET